MKTCLTCGSKLGARNKSGFCRHHFDATKTPEWLAKQKAGIRKALADPVKLEALRERARQAGKAPGATEKRREAAKRIGLYKIGHAALEGNQEARRRAGAKRTSTALAHIPRERREDYRVLKDSKRMRAAEAAELILAEHELEMTRFRREIMGARAT